MKKKACHITCVHARYDVRIFEKECVSLAAQGYDVTLIVDDNLPNEERDGIRIISSHRKKRSGLSRLFTSKNILFGLALVCNADIYHLHDPELLPLGNKLRRKGKTVIFDSHEDVALQIYEKKWLPSFLRKNISEAYKIYEKYSLEKYNGIVTVTPHLVERFKRINPKTFMITNYPRLYDKDYSACTKGNYICFTGGIDEQWNHDLILSALEELGGIQYLLAGKADEGYLDKLRRSSAWKYVEYRGVIPHEEVKNIHAKSLLAWR